MRATTGSILFRLVSRVAVRVPLRVSRFVPLGVLLAAGCGEGPPEPEVNVLLISLDSTRQDVLGCYGHRPTFAPEVATSPSLDRLAAEGVRFTRAYATTSWTLPAHAALLTGQPDLVHGVEMQELALGTAHETLAETLARAGYRTAGFYSGPFLDPRYGFARGFARYEACYGPELADEIAREARLARELVGTEDAARAEELRGRLQEARVGIESLSHRDVSSALVTGRVLEEIAAARGAGEPWFVFAHYFDPHYDYTPPERYAEEFDPKYAGSEHGADLTTSPSISVWRPTLEDPNACERVISDRDLAHVRALYDAEVRWTDDQIGRILDDLRARGELDRTVVVVTADHGDEFFEHGNVGHRKSLFEEVLRVPLLVRFPERLGAGKTVDAVASLVDVPATVLELTGLAEPGLAGETASRSLVPLATGARDGRDRFALGRLITRLSIDHESGAKALYNAVEEAFVLGPIKVRRLRRWIAPAPSTPPELHGELQALAERQRAADALLAWIDLDLHPGEELEQYSGDFADPRARAALDRFRELYSGWLAERRRSRPGRAASDEVQSRLLSGFGYGGSDEDGAPLVFERFTLPPPEAR